MAVSQWLVAGCELQRIAVGHVPYMHFSHADIVKHKTFPPSLHPHLSKREGHVKRFLSTRPLQQEYLAEADPCTNRQSIDEYCKSLLRFRVIGETPSRCSC